jgi:hypothetical protein
MKPRLISEAQHRLERLNATIAHQRAEAEKRAEELQELERQQFAAREQLQAEAAADPQPGDLWSEMCSYWLHVVAREGDQVTCLHAGGPCTFPQDGKLWEGTVAAFAAEWSTYSLYERGIDVSGWLSRWRAPRLTPPPPSPSEFLRRRA